MNGTRPKKHHYVPQFILRRFTDEDGMLHVFHKGRSDRRIFKGDPSNVFHERDLNTYSLPDGSKVWELEEALAQLEGQVEPIVEQIIERARRRRRSDLSVEQFALWCNFVYFQHKRPPKSFDDVGAVRAFDTDAEAYAHSLFERFPEVWTEQARNELRRRLLDEETRERIRQRAIVRARGNAGPEVVSILARRGLSIAVIAQPEKKSFLVSDKLLVRMGHSDLRHPDNELWLPISADVAVSPGKRAGGETLDVLNGDAVRRVNREQFAQATIIAARSPRLIRSLVEAG